MANAVSCSNARGHIYPSTVGDTHNAAVHATCLPPCRGVGFLILLFPFRAWSTFFSVIFVTFCALQVGCLTSPQLADLRTESESLLNKKIGFVALRSSAGPPTVLPFNQETKIDATARAMRFPQRSHSLRRVHEHQQRSTPAYELTSFIEKEDNRHSNFSLDLNDTPPRPRHTEPERDFNFAFDMKDAAEAKNKSKMRLRATTEKNFNVPFNVVDNARSGRRFTIPLRDAEEEDTNFSLDLGNTVEADNRGIVRPWHNETGKNANFSLDSNNKAEDAQRRTNRPRDTEPDEDDTFSLNLDQATESTNWQTIRPRDTKFGNDVDMFLGLRHVAEPAKRSNQRRQQIESASDVNLALNLDNAPKFKKGLANRMRIIDIGRELNRYLNLQGTEAKRPPTIHPWDTESATKSSFSLDLDNAPEFLKKQTDSSRNSEPVEDADFLLDLNQTTDSTKTSTNRPQDRESGKEVNFSVDMQDAAVSGNKSIKRSLEAEHVGDINVSLRQDSAAQSNRRSAKRPQDMEASRYLHGFSSLQGTQANKTRTTRRGDIKAAAEAHFSLDFDDAAESPRTLTNRPQKAESENNGNFSFNLDQATKAAPNSTNHPQGTESEKIISSSVGLEDVAESAERSIQRPRNAELVGGVNLSLNVDHAANSEKRSVSRPQDMESGSYLDTFSVLQDMKASKTPTKDPRDTEAAAEANFFLNMDSEKKSTKPFLTSQTGRIVSSPSDGDELSALMETKREKLPSPRKSSGELDFAFDLDDAPTPKTGAAKPHPRSDEIAGDSSISPDLDKAQRAKKPPRELPRRKVKTEDDFNFSLDLHDKAASEKPSHKASPTDKKSAADFNFSLNSSSPEASGKTIRDPLSTDAENEVYTLLDEEEDVDDDDDTSDKARVNTARMARPKPRFKLSETPEDQREMSSAMRKRTTGLPKTSTEGYKGVQKKQSSETLPGTPLAERLSSDDWYKLNTTASSAEFVKSLEAERTRQREARNALAEKRLEASPLVNVYTRAVNTFPVTNYLGIGYDSVKGNPLGDPAMMADPGLRSPVIVFTFEQSQQGVTNDLSTLQPIGAYTRPFAACRQSETISELSSLQDYQKELTVDASMEGGDSLGLNKFSGSAGYQNMAKELSSKDNKTYLLKTYCIRYEAGIAQTPSFNWNYTVAFQDAVSHLPDRFDGENEDILCSVAQWRQDNTADACVDTNIPTWMNFMEQFGTHYVVRLFAGGKMTYQVSIKSSDVNKLKNEGVDVKSELKVMLGAFQGGAEAAVKSDTLSASHVKSLDIAKETLVIGGKPPGNVSDPAAMAQWADSVEELPMPVKVDLQSLEDLLPQDKQIPFQKAAKYYGKAYGMSVQDLQALEVAPEELPEILRRATQVAWAGPPPGYAKCPVDTVVLFGYAIKLNFNLSNKEDLTPYRLVACAAGREKCDGVGTMKFDDDDERIFVVCGKQTFNELYQVTAESPPVGEQVAVATCPEGTVIILGFGFAVGTSAEHVEVESCRRGQTVCTKSVGAQARKSFVWMVCIEKNYPGIKNLHNVVQIDSQGPVGKRAQHKDGLVTVSCPEDESILLGFAMEAHTHMSAARPTYTTCPKNESVCFLQGVGVTKGMFGTDYHSLLSWIVCSPKKKEPVHAVTDNPESGGKHETLD